VLKWRNPECPIALAQRFQGLSLPLETNGASCVKNKDRHCGVFANVFKSFACLQINQ
jgi:hypothetical protein